MSLLNKKGEVGLNKFLKIVLGLILLLVLLFGINYLAKYLFGGI